MPPQKQRKIVIFKDKSHDLVFSLCHRRPHKVRCPISAKNKGGVRAPVAPPPPSKSALANNDLPFSSFLYLMSDDPYFGYFFCWTTNFPTSYYKNGILVLAVFHLFHSNFPCLASFIPNGPYSMDFYPKVVYQMTPFCKVYTE